MPTSDLKTFAYTSIKEKLLHCDYEPGSVLNETALCQELKISRTPIREALNRLSQENLIQVLPKKGHSCLQHHHYGCAGNVPGEEAPGALHRPGGRPPG